MANDEPRTFDEDVFPAELTEIYRRHWKLSLRVTADGSDREVFPELRELEDARKELGEAEKKLRKGAEKKSLSARLGRWLRIGKGDESNAETEILRTEVKAKRSKLAQLARPSVDRRLIGLAFSGGGIRSATFNLGILQALADLGMLRFFDYLSTVSGGGYIGSWLCAWIWHERKSRVGGFATVTTQLQPALSRRRREEAKLQTSPSATVGKHPEPCGPDPIFHLRRFSNYLTPRLGVFSQDTWSAIAIYLRNLILIQLMLIPSMAVVLLMPRLLAKGFVDLSLEWSIPIALIVLLILAVFVLVSISSALNHLRDPDEKNHFGLRQLQWRICVPVLAASIIFAWLFGAQRNHLWPIGAFGGALVHDMDEKGYAFLVWGLALGIFNVGVYLLCALLHHGDKFHRVRIFSDFISGAVAGILLYVLVRVALWPWGDAGRPWDIASFGPPLFLIAFLLAVTVQVGLRAVTESDEAREWRASMAAWLLIYALFWIAIFAVSFYGPLGWAYLADWGKTKSTLILGWLGSTLATILVGKSPRTGSPANPSKLEWVMKIGPVIAVLGLLIAVATVSHKIVTHWSPPPTDSQSNKLPLAAKPPKAIQAEFAGTLQLNTQPAKFDVNLKLGETPPPPDLDARYAAYWKAVNTGDLVTLGKFLIVCVVIVVILALRVDVNEFSLHAFYRNRLVRCYLGASRGAKRRREPITGFDPKDDLLLAKLSPGPDYRAPACFDGPYPIINTALNQMAGTEMAWQQRKATSFVLTPRYCGSGETGFRETEDFCGGMELGTAFAISGAAVSPNMGYHSSGPIAFLLTLFNARLGWWVRNPKKDGDYGRRAGRVWFPYLLTELFGQTTAESRNVYLSDGGHFENLGIYELVRRRCKYIVCCDVGADPLMGFEDLGNAIRKIRGDLGVNIEIDCDMVRPLPEQRHTRWHQAIGTIRYDQVDADESVGMLLYIKSSLTGDEPGDVLEHAGQHPLFPHDTTADQFFDESQFESYRKLGEHVAWEVFRWAQREIMEVESNGAVDRIFNALRHHWVSMPGSIRDSFLGQKEALVRLEARLRDDPDLESYDTQIYPEIVSLLGGTPPSDADRDGRAGLHFCNMQLQLMENVFLGLEFNKYHSYALNRGWMNLFRRWTTTRTFQKLWPALRGGYSRRFVDFVDEQLMPGEEFRIVNKISDGLTKRLVDHFKADRLSERLSEDKSGNKISPDFLQAIANPVAAGAVAGTWFAVPTIDPETEVWGAAAVTRDSSGDAYRLFVWVRGGYRNLGVGGKLLDEALSSLKGNLSGKLLVDLGDEEPGNATYQERKGAWFRFYAQRGFIREFKPDSDRLRLALKL